jgi:uncharacterized protein YmfQ (DUF2313 family)
MLISIRDQIVRLVRQLYPKSRIYKIPEDSYWYRLEKAEAASKARAHGDALAILSSILPDNDNFTTADATDWERRLGLITNPAVSLANRKLAIQRKMNHPGTIKARQHYLYVQGQLQAAGFNVFVHENIFDDGYGDAIAIDPADFIEIDGIGELNEFELDELELGDATTVFPELFNFAELDTFDLGGNELNGAEYTAKIANSLSAEADASFNIGENYRSTFFIGGEAPGTFANVDLQREREFRQLVLKLKPSQTIAFLLIDYIEYS